MEWNCCPWCGNMTTNPLGFCSDACYVNHRVESNPDSITAQQIREMEEEWDMGLRPMENGKRGR